MNAKSTNVTAPLSLLIAGLIFAGSASAAPSADDVIKQRIDKILKATR